MTTKLHVSVLVLALLAVSPAVGQVGTATVRGEVRDQAQAVIPTAKVTLTNTQTNIQRESQTNGAGLYTLGAVVSGSCRLGVEVAGMQKYGAALSVLTGQEATVDVTMSVAQAVTQISVQDVTSMVQVDSPSLSHVLER